MSWKEVEIENIALVLRNGASIKQTDNAGGTPITRIETIAKWNINSDKCGYADVSEQDYPNHILQDGDILISHINSTKHLGKCAIYEGTPKKLIHGMNLLGLRVDPTIAFPKYIYNVLSSEMFRNQLPQITKNSVNQSSFTTTSFKKLKIPLPPLDEQKRIAAILDKADALRRKREKAIALTDDLLRSVFLDMFGDPITNPKGWVIAKFGDLGNWASGGTPSRAQKEYFEGDIDWYSAGELNTRYLYGSVEKVTPKAIKESSAKIFKAGSMLIGMYDTAAFKTSILVSDSSSNQACANVFPNSTVSIEWLYTFINISKDSYLRRRRGVRQKNLNLGMIKEFDIPLPPAEIQKDFEIKCRKIIMLKEQSNKLNILSDNLFHSLTQSTFSGDLTEQKEAA